MTATSSSEDLPGGPTKPTTTAPRRSFLAGLRDEVHMAHTDLPILACCTVSGLCDSVAFNATGTFASMQTGNTIFLALGAARLPANQPLLWLRAIVSIASFWAGCFLFSKVRHFRPHRKLTLAACFLLQAVLVLVAAALAQSRAVPAFGRVRLPTTTSDAEHAATGNGEDSGLSLIPLALLAFQFGGQIVMSRVLGVNEVPTNVLTSLYCDLLSDPLLLAPVGKNPKRNRRVASIVLLMVGGIAGGWMQRSAGGMSSALWLAGGIKFCLGLAWLGWRSKEVVPKKGGALA